MLQGRYRIFDRKGKTEKIGGFFFANSVRKLKPGLIRLLKGADIIIFRGELSMLKLQSGSARVKMTAAHVPRLKQNWHEKIIKYSLKHSL